MQRTAGELQSSSTAALCGRRCSERRDAELEIEALVHGCDRLIGTIHRRRA
jgi:hypothetical protein